MEMKHKKLIIDCDPGIDDAFALAYALMQKDIEILGVTTVTGNVSLDRTTQNALIIEDLFQSSIPVYAGEENSLTEMVSSAKGLKFHGEDGLGDIGLILSERRAEKEKASDFILETLCREEAQSVVVICLGPLTNIASAIRKDPECMKRAAAIYSMGGSVLSGNASPVAEFNYWVDPIAANIVYNSGIHVHMIGLNLCNKNILSNDILEKLKSSPYPHIRIMEQMLKRWSHDIVLYDLIAIIGSLSPDIVKWLPCSVDISTTKVTRGECLADLVDAWKKEKNCSYAVDVDVNRLRELFCNTFLSV